ncbi:MAG: TIGR04282 family arsenosugar biosynthesis glycosyltransferase [Chloroflexota bacterium]
MKRALIIMAKRPFPGQTKTRLTPPFTPETAAQLYECLLQDTLSSVRTTAALTDNLTPVIAFSPKHEEAYFQQLAPNFILLPQQGSTLSERLDNVLTSSLQNGYAQVAAINSDSPSLPPAYLTQAFAELDKPATDLVLGPVSDGGYYLIGWKRPLSPTVLRVQMSTPHVLNDTLQVAADFKLKTVLLPSWHDIDEIEDLEEAMREDWVPHESYLAQFMNAKRDFFSRITHHVSH